MSHSEMVGKAFADPNLLFDIRKWTRPNSGYFAAYVAGASLIATPLGAELYTQIDLPADATFWDQCQRIGWAANQWGNEPGSIKAIAHDLKHMSPLDVLSPQNLSKQGASHQILKDTLVGLGMLEDRVGEEEMKEDNKLHTLMAGFPRYLPHLRFLFGPDTGLRHSSSTYVTEVGWKSPAMRRLVHTLQQTGQILPEEIEGSIPEIAHGLVGTLIAKPTYLERFVKGVFPVVPVIAGKFNRDILNPFSHQDPDDFTLLKESDVSSVRDLEGSAVPLTPILSFLATTSIEWMRKAGWVYPETFFELPLMLLEKGFESQPIPGVARTDNWEHKERGMRTVLQDFLQFSLPGQVMEKVNDILLHIAAENSFHLHLANEGIPLTYPQLSPDGSIRLIEARSEALLVDLFSRRESQAAQLFNPVSALTTPDRYNYNRSAIDRVETLFFRDNILSKHKIQKLEKETDGMIDFTNPRPGMVKEIYEDAQKLVKGVGFNPLSQQRKQELQRYVRALKSIAEVYEKPAPNYHMGGYFGDRTKSITDVLQFLIEDNVRIAPVDVVIKPGVPLVVAGENGGGKSALIATILQQLTACGKVVSAVSEIPPESVQSFAVGDRVELEGRERVFWGRTQGESSFILEIKMGIERMTRKIEGEKSYLELGDEVYRRTDQLNAMALTGTEMIVDYIKGNLQFISTHCNSMNRVFGPLFREIGLVPTWSTMEDYRLKHVDESTLIESKAFYKAMPFLPVSIGKAWAEKKGVESMNGEFGEFSIDRSYKEIHKERLKQLGWIRETTYSTSFGAMAEKLLGYGYEEDCAQNLYEKEDDRIVIPILINTVLNPRWKYKSHVSDWIIGINENEKAVEDSTSSLYELSGLYFDISDFLGKNPAERDPSEGKALMKKVNILKQQIPQLTEAASQLTVLFPDLNMEDLTSGISQLVNVSGLAQYKSVIDLNAIEPLIIAESLRCIAQNGKKIGLKPCVKSDVLGFHIKDIWGFMLAQIKKGKENIVKNDVDLTQSLVFTGPQNSGKTEALFSLSELIMASTLFGMGNAEQIEVGGNWEILPLITIPEFDSSVKKETRPVSSHERESRDRIGLIAQFCDNLPEGVRPIIVCDELLSATNTGDASEGIRAVKEYVESRGGIVIIATHSHEAVWDLEKEGKPFLSKHVGLFTSPEAYEWKDGHGESMGIEAAEAYGMPAWPATIAKALRSYLVEVKNQDSIPPEIILRYGDILRDLLQE